MTLQQVGESQTLIFTSHGILLGWDVYLDDTRHQMSSADGSNRMDSFMGGVYSLKALRLVVTSGCEFAGIF